MSVLSKEALEELIAQTDYSKKLIITPLLSLSQIGPASIDIRLGSSIVIPRRTFVSSHDVTSPIQAQQVEKRVYDRCRLKYHSEICAASESTHSGRHARIRFAAAQGFLPSGEPIFMGEAGVGGGDSICSAARV
jgi:hypothetical protein